MRQAPKVTGENRSSGVSRKPWQKKASVSVKPLKSARGRASLEYRFAGEA